MSSQDVQENQALAESLPPPSAPIDAASRFNWPAIILISFLVLCSVLPYLNTLQNGFVYDDATQVLKNPYVRNFSHLREIFITNVWSYRGGAPGVTNYYRPLMLLSYLALFLLFGPHAFAFHAFNILLHVAVVIVLFGITERIFKDRQVAFATALVFAVHPIHTEPVNWIAAVPDLEVALFCLLTFWFFLELARWTGRRQLLGQAGMAASFILALLAKEPAVTLPLLATVYEHLYRDDRGSTSWARKISRYGVLWALNIGYVVLRSYVLGTFTPQRPSRDLLPGDVLLSVIALLGEYTRKFLWPLRMSAFYVFPRDLAYIFDWMLVGTAALIAFSLLFWVFWSRKRLLCFGFIWFLATLVPVLNPQWMPESALAERYLYLPSVGLCWIVGWGIATVFRMTDPSPVWRWVFSTAAVILLGLCAARVVIRNRDWHDDLTFYTTTLAVSPYAFQMRNNLGQTYYDRGDPAAAEREWVAARRLWPRNYILLNNLGLLYTDQRRYDEAIELLHLSLTVKPSNPDACVNLGRVYLQTGQYQLAEQQFHAALTIAPLSIRAHNFMGDLYVAEKRYTEAIEEFRRSIEIVPTSGAYRELGLAYSRLGERASAEASFRKAAAMDPRDARAHFAMASFYAENGMRQEALEEYDAGLKIDPDNPEARVVIQKLATGASANH